MKKEYSILKRISDWLDSYDRLTYWYRNKILIYGAIIVIFLAPAYDYLFDEKQTFTYYSTNTYSFLMVMLLASWLNRWRDEDSKWSIKGVVDRLRVYINLFILAKDEVFREKKIEERLYNISFYSFYGGIVITGLGKVSLSIRRVCDIENSIQRNFETISNYSLILSFLGVCIFFYVYYKYPDYIKIGSLFKKFKPGSFDWSKFTTGGIFVLDSKNRSHIDSLISANSNIEILKDFLNSLENWNPGRSHDEFTYQCKLERYLKKKMPEEAIYREYLLGEREDTNRGRADIVISESILIEMKKRLVQASDIDRAQGQIRKYLEQWNSKGLVVLLLCDNSYEYAVEAFSSFITERAKLKEKIIAIVIGN